ncbi:DUF6712 family protein [Bernardetia sp. Wsw4-3y2]|uniref:DUF6712 family protein n=1 Tax=Bernardetia sp. Wsw4-3y2 TaxID=3127471 RepID=UPI0030D398AB
MKLLIKDTLEVKQYTENVALTKSIKNIRHSLKTATTKFLFRYIPRDFYSDFSKKYDEGELNEFEEELLPYLQETIVLYAFAISTAKRQVIETDSGIHIVSTPTQKTAFEHQIKALKDSYLEDANYALEELLEFLTENAEKKELLKWRKSEFFTDSTECFVKNSKECNKIASSLNIEARHFIEMKSDLKNVQEKQIKATLTPSLYEQLLTQYKENKVSELNKKLLQPIKEAILYLGYVKYTDLQQLKNTTDGTTIPEKSNNSLFSRKQATGKVLNAFSFRLYEEGNAALGELKTLLDENYKDYPLYENSKNFGQPKVIQNDKNNSYYVP